MQNLTQGPKKDEGHSCSCSRQWEVQRGFWHLAASINIAAGAATCQTLCLSPRWVLVLCGISHANRQFRVAVRLYKSCQSFSYPRTWVHCRCSLLALQGSLGPAIKMRSWKLKALACVGPWVCIWKHLLPTPCNLVTGLLCSAQETLTGEGFISCDTVAFILGQVLHFSPDLFTQKGKTFPTSHIHSLSSDLSVIHV